ncbi:hypothetical protein AXF42_Ash019272 [Apostasia shenzhenica]|uniref:DUF8039 domain-containing protein n=1 Tax=Apostasia shenzhenica TaxID=1088818 RepID=A0A2I0ARF1_9ASPA|nr:hypothetical protein AXF42_Ash019272 [Apostasia shenzhenica]
MYRIFIEPAEGDARYIIPEEYKTMINQQELKVLQLKKEQKSRSTFTQFQGKDTQQKESSNEESISSADLWIAAHKKRYHLMFSDVDMSPSQPPSLSEGSPCLIASMQPNNIVALGRVINPGGSGVIVHNVPLGHGICSVSIDHVIDSSAPLPFPIDECYTIGYLIDQDNTVGDQYYFMDPQNISAYVAANERATLLSNRVMDISQGSVIIIPYNNGDHWMLAVLDPYSLLVYWMDPIGHKIRKDLHAIINTGLRHCGYSSSMRKQRRSSTKRGKQQKGLQLSVLERTEREVLPLAAYIPS